MIELIKVGVSLALGIIGILLLIWVGFFVIGLCVMAVAKIVKFALRLGKL